MFSKPGPRALLSLLALLGVVFVASAMVGTAGAGAARHAASERLVVRGDATVTDAGCAAGVCRIALTGGAFRGTPVGAGAYSGDLALRVADAFPNGEGGVCAPVDGRVVLGAGTPDRLVLDLTGDSCQDGAGPPDATAFTGLARFKVRHGASRFAHARGHGLATFLEDAADHDRMTLIGRIAR